MEGKYFKLYACCKAVSGTKRSAIYDLQRKEIHFIPNSFYQCITESLKNPIQKTIDSYSVDDQNVIKEYLQFLQEKELGFFTNEPEQFPELENTWESPELITNAIIDTSDKSKHNYQQIFNQLHELGCQAVQLRFFNSINKKQLSQVLSYTNNLRFRSIEVYLTSHKDWNSTEEINLFLKEFVIVSHFFVFKSEEEKLSINEEGVYINFIEKDLKLEDCGQIDPKYFTVSIPFFMEAKHYNTCLNRKISIDCNGEIKNCPSMKKSYGNFAEKPLMEVVLSHEFQDVWSFSKDKILVCKLCEFRYACSDCRAYITDCSNPLSKPAKCEYEP